MHTTLFTLIPLLLAGATQAQWQVTEYPDISNCDVSESGSYRIYTGTDTNCHNFDNEANCEQFTNGGSSHGSCSNTEETSGSVRAYNATTQCDFFANENCAGRRLSLNSHACGAGALNSFKCY